MYQINSAKDSQGNEDRYMEAFTRLLPQIQAYRQTHGGDLEGAFGAVAGTPWPEGRSVKLHDGAPEMTKDRTIKSVLGKYIAAPAAIGATALLAPGALPAIAHGLGSAGHAIGSALGLGGTAGAAPAAGATQSGGISSFLGGLGKSAVKKIGGSMLDRFTGGGEEEMPPQRSPYQTPSFAGDQQGGGLFDTLMSRVTNRISGGNPPPARMPPPPPGMQMPGPPAGMPAPPIRYNRQQGW